MSLPASLLPWIEARFLTPTFQPNTGGLVSFFATGTSTPKTVYHDAARTVPWTNPVMLDVDGRAVIFLATGGYDVVVRDANGVVLYTVENVEDVAGTFIGEFGLILAQGARNITTFPYVVTEDDHTITVDTTGATNPSIVLPPVATRTFPLTVINIGDVDLTILPDGTDTIMGVTGPVILPAGTAPTFTNVTFLPDPPTNWIIQNTTGITSNASGGLLMAVATLNNAQFSALPTTPFDLAPAPGVGMSLPVVLSTMILDATAGAFGNLGTVASLNIGWQQGATLTPATMGVRNQSGFPWLNTMLTAGVVQMAVCPPYIETAAATTTASARPFPRTDIENAKLVVAATNDVGNWTGGNPANVFIVRVFYLKASTTGA